MQKEFNTGLVVGKFSPLHAGHEFLIRHAISRCKQLITISYSKPEFERCSRYHRRYWLNTLFPEVTHLAIDDEYLIKRCQQLGITPQTIPDNDAPDDHHRQFVGWLCQSILNTTVNAVFTSEAYGDGFAQQLARYFQHTDPAANVTHERVDIERNTVPISATKIRCNPLQHRAFLHPVVAASFVQRICILGGESSGKSSLAEALATALNIPWVPEFGRTLWEAQNGHLSYSDMLTIAQTQLAHEAQLAQTTTQLICDTSPLTTLFYSHTLFQQVDPELQALAEHPYDVTFLCAPDFEFVQDGTRRDTHFRDQQHRWYIEALNRRNLPFIELKGSVEQRVAQALTTLNNIPIYIHHRPKPAP